MCLYKVASEGLVASARGSFLVKSLHSTVGGKYTQQQHPRRMEAKLDGSAGAAFKQEELRLTRRSFIGTGGENVNVCVGGSGGEDFSRFGRKKMKPYTCISYRSSTSTKSFS